MDKILRKGDPAPALGVFVYPDKYTDYTTESQQYKNLKLDLDKYLKDPPPPEMKEHTGILWFGAGVATTLLVISLIK